MEYRLVAPPTTEQHAENIVHLYVRERDGAPAQSARIKVWASSSPTGQPAEWTDDVPFRTLNGAGMLEFIARSGPMPEDRDYWMQIMDAGDKSQCDPIHFQFRRGATIRISATLQQDAAIDSREGTSMAMKYTVQAGDTLFGIARKFGVTVDSIVAANNIQNRNLIKPGMILTIPDAGTAPPAKPTPPPPPAQPPQPVQPGQPTPSAPQVQMPAVPDWYPPLPPASRPASALPLKDFPRPANDNGRGIHFGLDVSERSLEEDLPKCLDLGIKWILFYCGDEMQGEKCAVAAWNAGIMPLIRPKCKINGGQPNWVAFVQRIKQHNIPAYIQIYNEPGDSREWSGEHTPPGYESQYGNRFAGVAAQVYDAGGYPGIQILGKEELAAAVDAVKAQGRTDIWNKAWFSLHNYGVNHPPSYPYDEINQKDHPRATILEDDVTVLNLIAYAIWMKELIGFVLPMMGGEGGWIYGSEEDRRYPKCNPPYHEQFHVEMYDWFRKGYLSNGQPLADYLFSVAPWILSGYGEAEAWYGGVLGDKTATINAVKAMPPFVRKFSWDR